MGPKPTLVTALGRTALIVAALSLASAASAQSTYALNIRFHGQPYAAVRPQLLEMGFRAIAFPHDESSGCQLRGICQQYPESFACSGTGLAYCWFALTRNGGGGYIVVETRGETKFAIVEVRRPGRGDRAMIADALRRPR